MVHIVGETTSHIVYSRRIKERNGYKYYIGRASGKGLPQEIANFRAGDNGRGYMKTNTKFCRAIKKYGWKNVETNILAYGLSFEQARNLESYYIRYFDSFRNGYNENGGEGDIDGGSTIQTLEEDFTINKKNSNKKNNDFVIGVCNDDIWGKRAIRARMKKEGIVESTLIHYTCKSSDPSGNRYNEDFKRRWETKEEDIPDKSMCGALFE